MSVQTLQSQHLVAKDDSAGVIFVKTKTNQEGSGPRDPRHLYANPLSPSTCWVTALAIYLACHPRLEPGALLPGSNQKLRFSKVLTNLLKQGDAGKSYGTHSVRKGVATFASAGYQFLGRVVAGLPVNDSKFATLTPHFQDGPDKYVKSCVETMFP
ncbi:hypothetical protein PHYSODRAFT_482038, partial [Phytophthora sojae]